MTEPVNTRGEMVERIDALERQAESWRRGTDQWTEWGREDKAAFCSDRARECEKQAIRLRDSLAFQHLTGK